jgi:dUTP pyrophosphatase
MMQKDNTDSELWNQIQQQFEQLKKNAGIEPDEDYQKELEELLGFSESELKELDNHTKIMLSTKKVQIQSINELAVLPKYAYPTDSGFDLHSVVECKLPPFGRALIPTGIKVSFNEGIELQIRPKSGLAITHGITVLNTPGTVDAGYTGEIKVIVFNTNNYDFTISKGMKVAQGVFTPVFNGRVIYFENVEHLENKDRGENGFGSTGI